MKAVVVLDEMPDDCRHCRFRGMSYTGTSYCIFMTGDIPDKGKPDWCPAVPVPVKLPENQTVDDEKRALWHGWNSCIDAITNEEDQWISVDKELPDFDTTVLVYVLEDPDGPIYTAFLSSEDHEWHERVTSADADGPITHWRHLPEMPKIK